MFDIINNIKNKLSHPLMFEDCKNDQINPKVAAARRESTNRSAVIIRYQGWASE